MAGFAKLYGLDKVIPAKRVKKERLAKLYGLDARIPPRIKVTGDREVRAALRALGGKVRRTVLMEAMRLAMAPMHSRAIAEAPRDTGELARGINMVSRGEKGGKMSVVVTATRKEIGKYVGPVEYGAKKRNRAPDEFMLRAFDHESGRAARVVMDKIVEGIGREAERLR